MNTVIEVGKQSGKDKERVAWLRERKPSSWRKEVPYVTKCRRIPFPGRGVNLIDRKYAEWFEDFPVHLWRQKFQCGGCSNLGLRAVRCLCVVSNFHGWSVYLTDNQADYIGCFNIWREQQPEEYEKELERVIAKIREERQQHDPASADAIERWYEFNK